MSAGPPSAPPAVAPPAALAAGILNDGELILLAVRPSLWYILLVSWPVLAGLAIVAAAAWALDRGGIWDLPLRDMASFLSVVALGRLVWAMGQWLGRMYVLTNRRVLWILGMLRVQVHQCSLLRIQEVCLTGSRPERIVGVGTLAFVLRERPSAPPPAAPADNTGGPTDASPEDPDVLAPDIPLPAWTTLSRPREIQQAIEHAIHRVR